MEDDLNYFKIEDKPQFLIKRKMTSIFLLMEDNLKKSPKTIKFKIKQLKLKQ